MSDLEAAILGLTAAVEKLSAHVAELTVALSDNTPHPFFDTGTAAERLAFVLIEMLDERETPHTVPLSHREIAAMAGLSVSATEKNLANFEAQGIVTRKYKRVIILRTERLKALAKRIRESIGADEGFDA